MLIALQANSDPLPQTVANHAQVVTTVIQVQAVVFLVPVVLLVDQAAVRVKTVLSVKLLMPKEQFVPVVH